MSLEFVDHFLFWIFVYIAMHGVRSTYFEFKIGELLHKDQSATRDLDEALAKRKKRIRFLYNVVEIPLYVAGFVAYARMPRADFVVILMFVAIVRASTSILTEIEERKMLMQWPVLRPILVYLHGLTAITNIAFLLAVYKYCVQRLL